MKELNIVLKLIAVLAAIAGIVFVIVAYGDKIAAWFKSLMVKLGWTNGETIVIDEDDIIIEEAAAPAEQNADGEAPAAEEAVHADENDFEG